MNEMDLLTRFRAAVAPPSEDTLSEARARMLSSAEAGAPVRRGPLRRGLGHPPRKARFWLAPAGATAALAAVAIGAVAVSGVASHGAGTSVQLTAATVLQRAARAALTAPLPGKNQYTYALTVGGPGRKLNSVTKEWISVAGKRPDSAWTNDCHVKGDPSCMWSLYPMFGAGDSFNYTGVQHLPFASGALLGSLAKEQVRACAEVGGARMDRAGYEWSGIYTILSDVPVLPPHFGAALFNAAAKIPGVTVIRNARTGTGQRGIAVIRSVHPVVTHNPIIVERAELIFNPHTYRYIGNILLYGNSRAPVSSTLVTTRFVNSAPAGPERDVFPMPQCVAGM